MNSQLSSHEIDHTGRSREETVVLTLFLVFLGITILRNAWMCDDAYISFRTVDNFINGLGLTWNATERVQAFSHPLWLLVLSPVYAVLGDMYITALLMSVVFSLGAAAWFAFRLSSSVWAACLGLLVLTLSDAFIDFSTSGLENPLTFFLLALFLYVYFRREPSLKSLAILSLVASLGALNRLDTMVMYAPMLVYAFWQVRGRRAIKTMLIGFLPLIIWELFSLGYFGFLLPNPAYAKLGTGLDGAIIFGQGIGYLLASLYNDPITLTIIFAGIAIPIVLREKRMLPISIALMLQLIYILKIGGCFMSGRFLAAPLLVAVAVLTYSFGRMSLPKWTAVMPAVIILILGLTAERSPLYYSTEDSREIFELKNTVNDERCFYNPETGLMNYDRFAPFWPNHGWAHDGRRLRESGETFTINGVMGMLGFYAGPDVHIMDIHGLTDPFLARLPLYKKIKHKIGHYLRLVPAGYIETVKSGKNVISDTSLAKLYDKLKIITQDDIFSLKRFWEIIKFNLGIYSDLADHYGVEHMKRVDLAVIDDPVPEGTSWIDSRNVIFSDSGVQILLHEVRHDSSFEIGRDHNDILRARYYLHSVEIASNIIPLDEREIGGIESSRVEVPPAAAAAGYDEIRIFPEEGDGCYSMSHLLFPDVSPSR